MRPAPSIRGEVDRWSRMLREGRAAEALQPIAQLAAAHPTTATLQLLGECHLALDQVNEAVIPLAAAVGLSDRAEPAALLAWTLMKLDRAEEARLAAQRILHRDPRNRAALAIMQQLPRG